MPEFTTRSLIEFTYQAEDSLLAAQRHALLKQWLSSVLGDLQDDSQQTGLPSLHIRLSSTESPLAGDVVSAVLPTAQSEGTRLTTENPPATLPEGEGEDRGV